MDLLKRVLSAAVLIGIVVAILFLGEIPIAIFTAVISLLMMIDVSSVLKKGGFNPQRVVLILTSALVLPAVFFKGLDGYFILASVSFSVMAICVIFNKEPDFKTLFSGGFALIYPLMPATLLVFLAVRDVMYKDKIGITLCIGAVLCAALSDTFAYFFGKFFGKKKLCPQISPKKTVVGSVTSFFGGAVGGVIMHCLGASSEFFHVCDWIIIGFACGGFSQIGDLTASMLKRFCNVKDYGNYIPGHGGIMDRMDSISACLTAIVIYVQIFIPEIL